MPTLAMTGTGLRRCGALLSPAEMSEVDVADGGSALIVLVISYST
jgi:hypothetical protein